MTQHHYRVVGAIAPELPLRVLNLFAQQAIAIDGAQVARRGERYEIEVTITDLADQPAAIIAEKLRAMVLVEHVAHERHPAPAG